MYKVQEYDPAFFKTTVLTKLYVTVGNLLICR